MNLIREAVQWIRNPGKPVSKKWCTSRVLQVLDFKGINGVHRVHHFFFACQNWVIIIVILCNYRIGRHIVRAEGCVKRGVLPFTVYYY